ncbi:MAG: hypothetical protein ACI4F4_07230 [Lachnospiraceae bacterium]
MNYKKLTKEQQKEIYNKILSYVTQLCNIQRNNCDKLSDEELSFIFAIGISYNIIDSVVTENASYRDEFTKEISLTKSPEDITNDIINYFTYDDIDRAIERVMEQMELQAMESELEPDLEL